MKILYSIFLLVFYTIIVFTANSNAQPVKKVSPVVMAKRAMKVIPSSLDSNIPGIIESTIYNVIVVKKYYPSADFDNIIDKLNEIEKENPSPSIRFKAHLASIYLTFGNIIDVKPKHNVFEHDYIYRQIANQLEKKLLVSR